MTRKIYRTAQGKTVDLGALQLQNENVRAVGNMKVNARGDLIDSLNQPIASRNEQVAKQYKRQTTNVVNQSVIRKSSAPAVDIPQPPEDFDDNFDRSKVQSAASAAPTATGLAAAIARAREIRQTPITKESLTQTPTQTGPKKI